jgi:hypothetical protein
VSITCLLLVGRHLCRRRSVVPLIRFHRHSPRCLTPPSLLLRPKLRPSIVRSAQFTATLRARSVPIRSPSPWSSVTSGPAVNRTCPSRSANDRQLSVRCGFLHLWRLDSPVVAMARQCLEACVSRTSHLSTGFHRTFFLVSLPVDRHLQRVSDFLNANFVLGKTVKIAFDLYTL